jgi:cobalt-zinc-cadmium efflux system membrane fusion protein
MASRHIFLFPAADSATFVALAAAALALSMSWPVHAQTAAPQLTLDAQQQAALGVRIAPIQAAQVGPLLASATVTTPPGKDMTVTAPYAGQLSRVLVGLGDTVRVGTALGHFTSPMVGDARRLWHEASLEAQNSRAALQRDQALFDEGIIPAVRLQLSRNKDEAAKTAVQSRAAELTASGLRFDGPGSASNSGGGYATGVLSSPISGVVVDAFSSVGQRVEAGTVLFKLADTRELQLDIQLSGDKAARLKVGDAVQIPSRNAQAQITGVSRALDAGQSAKARAKVTQRGSLQIGEAVSIQLQPGLAAMDSTGKATGPAWTVPSRALSQWQNQPLIFVANATGFSAQRVRMVSSNDDISVIEAALPANAKVAVTGIASLRALLQKDE